MNLQTPISSSRGGQMTPHIRQAHILDEGAINSQVPSHPFTFQVQPQYQASFQVNQYGLQSNSNDQIATNEAEQLPAPFVEQVEPHSHRAKYDHLDWDVHKAAIESLYMDQNKNLSETMGIMKDRYSFVASQKLYKSKFKEWNWQKKLPVAAALFMQKKAKERKRDTGKDTVFSFGGRNWDSNRVKNTAARAKKTQISDNNDLVDTPEGVSYKTPKSVVASHSEVEMAEISNDDSEEDTDRNPGNVNHLTITWRGRSRGDLQEMWDMARNFRNAGRLDEAEDLFQQVFQGLGKVLGTTNEDTVKAAYNLADLYAESARATEAIEIIETVIQNHVSRWGYEDKRTQQNVLHAVELLNGWKMPLEAVALLSSSKELLQTSSFSHNQTRKKNKSNDTTNFSDNLTDIANTITQNLSPSGIDYGIGVARSHVAAKDQAVEELLLALIASCGNKPDFVVQHLRAHAELLKLYEKLGKTDEKGDAFQHAFESVNKAWNSYNWDDRKIASLDFMEGVLQLAANILKSGFMIHAKQMFREISDKATEVFGADDERTVWVLITIGLVYQTHLTWDDAEEWFEEAFTAALRNEDWGPKDGIVMSLQNAMDHCHFSYVSDEGRPFKTIFGVSGIKIMPGRLHLE